MYRPKKKFGQNFLADKKVLMRIIDAADLDKDDVVLEIGPGQGSLTYHLAQKAGRVIAVEKDIDMVEYLEKKFGDLKNLEIINEDILLFANSHEFKRIFANNEYKIVANIPYYLTSFLLRKIFEMENKPSEIILMIQKEVAERICAKNGEMNLLAVSVQVFSDPEILFGVSKNSFWPKPKVDSAVIRIKVKKQTPDIVDVDIFFNIVKTGFGAKRKVLANNLAKGLDISKEKIYDIFKELKINVNARAQDLGVEEWIDLYDKIKISKL